MVSAQGERAVVEVAGPEARPFLQGLVTNDVEKSSEGLIYAALLTPQGKYLFDFFLLANDGGILIDVAASSAHELMVRLSMYRLRSAVDVQLTDIRVARGMSERPPGAFSDPRHPALGWRAYGETPKADQQIVWDRVRVANCVPESGIELIPDKTFILEAGFERLNGVDFHKGCFVGQEVTARMKHKTELRRRLATVDVEGAAPVGTEITDNGRKVGILYSQAGGKGIAYLRFDRISGGPMAADGAALRLA